ncbi:MAG: polyketide cyclase [Solirubrobacterales bacterium]|nr:polyketide cyclase [Solirubrobacterales bacterium]
MGKVSTTVDIAAEPERVWAAISNPGSYERWLTIHTRWKGDVPATFSQGVSVDEVVTMLGMANTISWTVEEFEAPARLKISGTGMAGVRSTFTMDVAPREEGGSTASIAAEFEGQMVVGALGKAVEKDAQANLEQSLANLSALVAA